MSMSQGQRVVTVLACLSTLVSCERPTSRHAQALEEMTETVRATTRILKTIHSVDDARAAQAQLMALSQRALDTQKKMTALIGTKIPTGAKRYTVEKLQENESATRDMMTELTRLQGDPGIWEVLGASLNGFQ